MASFGDLDAYDERGYRNYVNARAEYEEWLDEEKQEFLDDYPYCEEEFE